ncbi:hypothetical protein [Chryseobacterium sp.]|uniref:hypothetical protein n=1 Tax=Chryseobacterium sp. TaxID=1871047 RepID=UPI00289FB65C|nr:hypothetical protein [Chryseobacterium sp.]
MGIIIVFVFIIALPMLLLSKISKRQKILWSVCIFISLVFLAMYILIQGFERGRDPERPAEELNQPAK